MRNAAMILGIIGGLVGMVVGFFAYGIAVLGEMWTEFTQAAQELGQGEGLLRLRIPKSDDF